MNVERYELLMIKALEIQQLRIEIRNKLRCIGGNITANELSSRFFDNDSAKKAFSLLSAKVDIENASHVRGKLKYNDVDIYLHQYPTDLGSKAMKEVLNDISIKSVLDA